MPVIAVLNALIRQFLFVKNYGEKAAHQISTITLIIFLGIYLYFVLNRWRLESISQAMWTGILWCFLTIIFEIGLGLASGKTFSEMLKAYDLFSGELWVFVPLFILIVPVLFYFFMKD